MHPHSPLQGANVLVAGGTGFIGSNLSRRLLSLGCHVRSTMHERKPVVDDERITYMQCDLTEMEDCRNVVKDMDEVFMCAANTSGAAVIAKTPLVHVTPNVVMNARLLEAAYHARVKKFLFLSSNATYPPSGERPVKEEEMFDGDPYEAYFGAAWMKRFTEVLCRMYAEKLKNPMVTVVLRPSNVYGPHDDYDFATSHVTAALIRRVIERHNPIEVWGTGDDIRDIIYIDDLIDAAILAMETVQAFDAFNIASGEGHSIKSLLRTMLEIDGYTDAKVVFNPSKPSMIPIRLIDTEKAKRVLGFRARTDTRDGLRKTIEWYRAFYNVPKPAAVSASPA